MTDYRFFPRGTRISRSQDYADFVISRLTPEGRYSMASNLMRLAQEEDEEEWGEDIDFHSDTEEEDSDGD